MSTAYLLLIAKNESIPIIDAKRYAKEYLAGDHRDRCDPQFKAQRKSKRPFKDYDEGIANFSGLF